MITTYLALLRGINVGGKNIIKMSALKNVVEGCGFTNVSTYIQSGNVIFNTENQNIENIIQILERELSKAFTYKSIVMVISNQQLKSILSHVPNTWKTHNDLRCYIAFIKAPTTSQDVLSCITLKEGIDEASAYDGAIYMSTLLSGITKSGFTKLIGTKVYKNITIRNYSTVRKIFEYINKLHK